MPNRLAFEAVEDRTRELLRWTPNVPSAVWVGAVMGVFIGTSTFLLGLLTSLPEMKVKWKFISMASFAVTAAFSPAIVGFFWPAAGVTILTIQIGSFLAGALMGRIKPHQDKPTTMAAMILARI